MVEYSCSGKISCKRIDPDRAAVRHAERLYQEGINGRI
nr:MAG TPA: hypothetical protein [Caudoviricetes sp.]